MSTYEKIAMLRELTATLMASLEREGSIHSVTARMAWELVRDMEDKANA